MDLNALIAHLESIHRKYGGHIPVWVYGMDGVDKCYPCTANDVTVGAAGGTFGKVPKELCGDDIVILMGGLE